MFHIEHDTRHKKTKAIQKRGSIHLEALNTTASRKHLKLILIKLSDYLHQHLYTKNQHFNFDQTKTATDQRLQQGVETWVRVRLASQEKGQLLRVTMLGERGINTY